MSPSFDPFRRFRPRTLPLPLPQSPAEDDSDESSPERDRPRIIHVLPPKNGRKSGERIIAIPDSGKPAHGAPENAHIAISFDTQPLPARPDRPSKMPSKPPVPSDSLDPLRPSTKQTLIRRMTSKLNISIPSKSANHALASRPSTRTLPSNLAQAPRSPRATIPVSPTLPNSFVSREQREAALRERGLLPPRKDLSVQEREADTRLGTVPSPSSATFDGRSEAEQLKANWLAMNRTSESSNPDDPSSPHVHGSSTISVRPSRSSSLPSDADILRRSSEGRQDLPQPGRPSICSSVPPLSTSSYLEVLHEEPSEHAGPITPPPPISPARLPIIISSPLDSPLSPMFAESPVSCSFSSHCPGSTLDSQSQSDHPHFPEKENTRSSSRRRTSDSLDRPRRAGSSLSRLGTGSLSNLRRSVAGSLRLQSSSALSTADLPPSSINQVPRTAISPTIHSIGSIIRETRDIADAESRRLSELAFLD